MKNNIINAAIQVLPTSKEKHPYDVVDVAIKVISDSGLKYRVCPFETVIEGKYSEVMSVLEKIHEACYNNGAESMLTYVKIQTRKNDDVRIEDKMEKYV